MSTDMIWQTNSTGSEDTERLGGLLGQRLKAPVIIELRADLGGGKTTFVRGLAKGFGSHERVTSPTFMINKLYKNQHGQAIHHFDFYRLEDAGIMKAQLAESLKNRQVVTVVEWGGVVLDVLPAKRLIVEFKLAPDNPDARQITIHYPGAMAKVIKEVETAWQPVRP